MLDLVALDLPEQDFLTQALWYELPDALLQAEFPLDVLQGSLHAAEHGQIAVLPLLAMCDRWDIGGLSTAFHHQTGRATIFIYDGHPGGVGITRAGFFEALVDDALRLISECPCRSGCPSCVQSPKCGNLNEPLNKRGAIELLSRMAAGGWCTRKHVCARRPLKHPDGRPIVPITVRARRIAPLFLAAVVAAWPPAAALAGDGGGAAADRPPSGVERNGGAPTTKGERRPKSDRPRARRRARGPVLSSFELHRKRLYLYGRSARELPDRGRRPGALAADAPSRG